MANISLNSTQLTLIERDLNALEILMPMQIFAIAEQIDSQIRFPRLNPEDRYKVICKIIKKIDRELYQIVPNEYYDMINSEEKGIKMQEAEIIKQRLVKVLLQKMNIPLITEFEEEKLFEIVISNITNSIIEGNKL